MIEDEDFVLMMEKVDRRLTVPKKTKSSNIIDINYVFIMYCNYYIIMKMIYKNSKRDWLLPQEYLLALTCGQKKKKD